MADHRPTTVTSGQWRTLALAMLVMFSVVVLRTAWMSDDAYLTFRTVENFNHGYGLRWNVAERVQAYTHPLWMMCLAAATRLTGDFYLTGIVISCVFSVCAVAVLIGGVASAPVWGLLGATVLILSKSFIDYSTSGLENALTHFLLVMFFLAFFRGRWKQGGPGLAIAAGLLLLNRLDLILLILPSLLAVVWQAPTRRTVRAFVIGFAPFVAWEIFSLVYYGFPFPNTAYAKLKTGIPAFDLAKQAFLYFLDSINGDPLTLVTIGTMVIAGLFWARNRSWPISLGILLYLAYVIRIGGDFMSGRFLAAPLLCAVIVLARMEPPADPRSWPAAFALTVFLGLMAPHPTVWSNAQAGGPEGEKGVSWSDAGIADERLYYYPYSGLLRVSRGRFGTVHPWAERGQGAAAHQIKVLVESAVGLVGFHAGPSVYVVDTAGLGDPLLARLPPKTAAWRIGHYFRNVPDGYVETLESGKNVIQDLNVARYYNELTIITRGPLWSRRRWRAIWNFALGRYEPLITTSKYAADAGG